jgi:hypothetical protein
MQESLPSPHNVLKPFRDIDELEYTGGPQASGARYRLIVRPEDLGRRVDLCQMSENAVISNYGCYVEKSVADGRLLL